MLSVLNKDEIEQTIKKLFCDTLHVSEDVYSLELGVGDIPEWDSIGHLTLLQAVEATFEITFDVGDAIDIESVDDLIQMVHKYLQA